MQASEYRNVKNRMEGGVSAYSGTHLSRRLRRNMAANEARERTKAARKNWFKKTL